MPSLPLAKRPPFESRELVRFERKLHRVSAQGQGGLDCPQHPLEQARASLLSHADQQQTKRYPLHAR
jgi:hypothetical protein